MRSPPDGQQLRLGLPTWSWAKTTCWDRVASGITGKRSGEARYPLAAHLGEGKLGIQSPAVLQKYPHVKRRREITLRSNYGEASNGGLMSNSGHSSAALIGGREPLDIRSPCGVHAQAGPTILVSDWMLQPSNEPVVGNSSAPSDFLVESQASWLGNVHPLLTLSFFNTWFLPLHDGLKGKRCHR